MSAAPISVLSDASTQACLARQVGGRRLDSGADVLRMLHTAQIDAWRQSVLGWSAET